MSQQSVQLDPLNSPHPIPWNWVMATLSAKVSDDTPRLHCYRSQSLLSPDRQFAAYSRIQMQAEPQFFRSRISSVLFIENLKTGDLQAITPSSPLADNPFIEGGIDLIGSISIVIPVSWSEAGDRLLAREFESLFGSSMASDYAVIVDRPRNRIKTVAPCQTQYTTAILLGWSELDPSRVLFRAGNLGEEAWQLLAVDGEGQTCQEPDDQPITFGHVVSSVWTGPQVQN